MDTISPIKTTYRNVVFRSRLEARWAVYFDEIGIEWEYEKEGYNLPSIGYYLPDFFLPQVEMWAEVKPQVFTEIELRKCIALHRGTGFECLLLDGPPAARSYFGTHAAMGEEPGSAGLDYVLSADYLREGRFYGFTGSAEFPDHPCIFGPTEYQDREIDRAVGAAKSFQFW